MRKNIVHGFFILILSLLGLLALTGNAAAQEDAAILGGLGLICILVVLLPIILVIFIAVWVYRDAESRGMSGILWVLIVIFVPYFIGLIIYFVVRRDHPIRPPGYYPPPGGYPPPGYGGYPPPGQGGYPPPPPPPPQY